LRLTTGRRSGERDGFAARVPEFRNALGGSRPIHKIKLSGFVCAIDKQVSVVHIILTCCSIFAINTQLQRMADRGFHRVAIARGVARHESDSGLGDTWSRTLLQTKTVGIMRGALQRKGATSRASSRQSSLHMSRSQSH
jgi:hypothetical protein